MNIRPASIFPVSGGSEAIVEVSLDGRAVTEACLGLCCLRYGVCEAITFERPETPIRLIVRQDLGMAQNLRGRVRWNDPVADISVTSTELDACIVFLLEYVRDGAGAVDHMDVELSPAQKGTRPLFLILKVDTAKPALSRAEFFARMGIPDEQGST